MHMLPIGLVVVDGPYQVDLDQIMIRFCLQELKWTSLHARRAYTSPLMLSVTFCTNGYSYHCIWSHHRLLLYHLLQLTLTVISSPFILWNCISLNTLQLLSHIHVAFLSALCRFFLVQLFKYTDMTVPVYFVKFWFCMYIQFICTCCSCCYKSCVYTLLIHIYSDSWYKI